jgi:hypothetical protein
MGDRSMPYPKGLKRFKIMSTENIAVEAQTETAASQSQENQTVTTTGSEVDYEAELAKKDAEIAKINADKENYRKGLLKAKGKIPDEDDNSSNEGEDIDSKVKRLVQEQLLATKEAQAIAEKENLVKDLARKNKELTLALKNRGQVTSTSGQGSNQDRPEVKTDSVFSEAQLAALKAKGLNPEEVKNNLNKVNQMPR